MPYSYVSLNFLFAVLCCTVLALTSSAGPDSLFLRDLKTAAAIGFDFIKPVIKGAQRLSRKLGQAVGITESCHSNWINTDNSGLRVTLENELFGQVIATKEIPNILGHYWQNEVGSKNLVLCFYGGPGTGKTYATKLLNKHIFSQKDRSYYYHFYSGSDSALYLSGIGKLKNDMTESIVEAINECPFSIIVFDEAHKYPHGFLDSIIIPLLENNRLAKESFGKATFIFLTNIGENEVTDKALEIHNSYFSSNTLSNYESVALTMKKESKDPFFSSGIVQNNYVTGFIPFIPHTKTSFLQCFDKQFPALPHFNSRSEIKTQVLRNIMDKVKMIPSSDPTFIKSGCKRIETAIAFEIKKLMRNSFADEF